MIITRTPMRISFVGGATDLKSYYSKFGGEVVSCAINRYIYITYNKRDDDKIVVSYTKTESVDSVDQVQHPIVKEAMKMAGIKKGVEIHIISNISTIGTGLGGSSAVAVGLLRAFFPQESNYHIAELACNLEIDRMKKCIGKQDQFACAIGGFNRLGFCSDGFVSIENLDPGYLTGKMFLLKAKDVKGNRCAEKLLRTQNDVNNINLLHSIKDLPALFLQTLENKDDKRLCVLINHYWGLKRQLSEYVTNEHIDNLIHNYITKGCGAKLCGAGQSGFIFIYDPSGQCDGIPVQIDYQGTIISYI